MSSRIGASGPAGTKRRTPSTDFDRDAFLARLARMGAEARLEAARFEFTARQRTIWIANYPDEAPLVNGEYEHIALRLADLD
jgi:hypothetical protein